jgi:hypothetical protein
MSITPFLNGHRFDRESRRVLALLWQILSGAGLNEAADAAVKERSQ